MTRQELEIKAKEFDSKLKRHPMSSEELQKVLCDFSEALRIHDVVGRSEQLKAFVDGFDVWFKERGDKIIIMQDLRDYLESL